MPDVREPRPGELADAVDDLVALLASRYSGEPWRESDAELRAEAELVAGRVGDPGVHTAVAVRDGTVVGIAQGSPGDRLLADLAEVAPEEAARWVAPVFELHQLVVSPAVGGGGVGARLHDRVLADVGAASMLLTHPEAEEARRLYAGRGWAELASFEVAPGHPRILLGRRVTPGRPWLEDTALALLLGSALLALVPATRVLSPALLIPGLLSLLFAMRWSAADRALGLLAFGVLGAPLVLALPGPWSRSVQVVLACVAVLWLAVAVRLARSARSPSTAPRGLHMR